MARRRFKLRRLVFVSSVFLLSILFAGAAAVSCKPAWYEPRAPDFGLLNSDRDDLVRIYDSVGQSLNSGRTAVVRLSEEQINRWLAARYEIWPDAEQWDIPGLEHPVVRIGPEGVRLGAMFRTGSWAAVLSCVLRAEVGPDTLRVRCESYSIGRVHVPARWIGGLAREAIARAPVEAIGADDTSVLLANEWLWQNGRRGFRVKSVRLTRGEAVVELQPLP